MQDVYKRQALEVEQDILNSFRKNGFELISPRFNHMRNFLTLSLIHI